MPLIKVQTSLPTPAKAEVETLLKELSSSLASHLGKPESYVMTAFAADANAGGASGFARRVQLKQGGSGGPEAGNSRRIRGCRRKGILSTGRTEWITPDRSHPGRRQAM
jgi:phenylpyruvate tautomerase